MSTRILFKNNALLIKTCDILTLKHKHIKRFGHFKINRNRPSLWSLESQTQCSSLLQSYLASLDLSYLTPRSFQPNRDCKHLKALISVQQSWKSMEPFFRFAMGVYLLFRNIKRKKLMLSSPFLVPDIDLKEQLFWFRWSFLC